MKSVISLWLTIFGVTHLMAADWPILDSVVKLYSGICEGDSHKMRGSGILFEHEGKTYALTSEHVVLHDKRFCHSVWNEAFGERKADLVQVDWGLGLALLRIEGKPPFPLASLDFFKNENIQAGDSVITTGFAHQETTRIVDTNGRVLIPASPRALIPQVPMMLETVEAHGEFGMSGGPVFSDQGKRFLGLMTHQYLKVIAGRPSQLGEFSETTPVADHLFILPAQEIHRWLFSLLEGEATIYPSFLSEPLAQLQGKSVVYSSGLRFEAKSASGNPPIGGSDGAGGGSDGAGGGSDGAGGGSEEAPRAQNPNIVVEITLDMESHMAKWDFSGREKWVQRVRAQILRQAKVTVPFFIEKTEAEEIHPVSFRFLAQFVRLLSDKRYEPVTLLKPGLDEKGASRLGADEQNLIEDGKWLLETASRLEKQISVEQSLDGRRLLGQLKLLGELLKGNNGALAEAAWVTQLEKGYSAGWRYLMNHHYEEGVELLRRLLRVGTTLDRLRL